MKREVLKTHGLLLQEQSIWPTFGLSQYIPSISSSNFMPKIEQIIVGRTRNIFSIVVDKHLGLQKYSTLSHGF